MIKKEKFGVHSRVSPDTPLDEAQKRDEVRRLFAEGVQNIALAASEQDRARVLLDYFQRLTPYSVNNLQVSLTMKEMALLLGLTKKQVSTWMGRLAEVCQKVNGDVENTLFLPIGRQGKGNAEVGIYTPETAQLVGLNDLLRNEGNGNLTERSESWWPGIRVGVMEVQSWRTVPSMLNRDYGMRELRKAISSFGEKLEPYIRHKLVYGKHAIAYVPEGFDKILAEVNSHRTPITQGSPIV